MADRKISADSNASIIGLNFLIPIVDEDEPNAEDRNKWITPQQLFGLFDTFTEDYAPSFVGPRYYVFGNTATAAKTFTLPPGTADIDGIPIKFINRNATYDLTIEGDGTDIIRSSDPFVIVATDTNVYTFVYKTGDGWYVSM